MMRDVAADEGGADPLGLERRDLLVERTDARALFVVEHGAVDRAGDVILGELAPGPGVDHLVKFVELCYGS